MSLAIHHNQGSFSDRWIQYCDENRIAYRIVNCLDTNIMRELAGVNVLLWHWNHQEPAEILAARHVVMAAEASGIIVFPDVPTCWHFDDKVAQKYLLEAVQAPLVPAHVFYDREKALHWVNGASFPKVFKLRKGAGSANVHLISTREEARKTVRRAFSSGFRPVPEYWNDAALRYRAVKRQRDFLGALRRLPVTLKHIRQLNRMIGRERGYVYFQDFIPNNQFDTRVTIVGDRAFGFIRKVRPGDFRASGSGEIDYAPHNIRLECVHTAFQVIQKIGCQSLAFDFVITPENRVMIIEVSYCYAPDVVYNCSGYWDSQINWHAGHVWPQDAIIEDVVKRVAMRESLASRQTRSKIADRSSDIRSAPVL